MKNSPEKKNDAILNENSHITLSHAFIPWQSSLSFCFIRLFRNEIHIYYEKVKNTMRYGKKHNVAY